MRDTAQFRAWVFARQGLERCRYGSAPEALIHAGWQRSVGGANPYLALHARSGESRAEIDAMASDLRLFELPSVRGCTYVLPADHFALGLALSRSGGSATEIATAHKLGVTDEEIEALKAAVVVALGARALSPVDLKQALGDAVRNLGEEGKKRGLITTLPLALGLLQIEGAIRRKPVNGRLDTQRYTYELWNPPLVGFPTDEEAATECARLFFAWAGAATVKEFREFSLFGATRAKEACDRAGVVRFGEEPDLLSLPNVQRDFETYTRPDQPVYQLVGSLDSYLLLRRGSRFWLDDSDYAATIPTEKGLRALSEVSELGSHAILDRGRLVGLWEFCPEDGRIAWTVWIPTDDALLERIEATERYVREDLADARSFSLDSPASRQPRIDALRDLQSTRR